MSADDKAGILLVDDQPSRLLSYEAILADLGEHLIPVKSGEQALLQLMQREFAVIVLDVIMPGLDGFETAALIHEHPRLRGTPIIFVTGIHDSEFDRLRGYRLGAVDYVTVPIIPEVLRSKVAVLVELYRQRRQLQVLNEDLSLANAELALANRLLVQEQAKELEQLNAHLEDANRQLVADSQRKDEFLAMLGHELRNPLAAICNVLEIIKYRHQVAPDPELSWPCQVLARQVRQLSRLVDDLLDMTRITRNQIELQRAPLDLGEVVEQAEALSR